MRKPAQGIDREGSNLKLSLLSLMIGLGSIAGLLISVILAFTVEVIGAVSLFRGLVLPLAVAAIVVGVIATNKTPADNLKSRRQARLGIILGAVTFGIIILVMLTAVLLFIPLRFIGAWAG